MKSKISPAVAVVVVLVVVIIVAAIGYTVLKKKPTAGAEDGDMVDFAEGSGTMKSDPVDERDGGAGTGTQVP